MEGKGGSVGARSDDRVWIRAPTDPPADRRNLIGTILFWLGSKAKAVTPTEKEAYDCFAKTGKIPAYYQPFSPLVYSLETFLPLVKLGQGDEWAPNPNAGRAGKCLRRYLWVHMLMGWLLTALFVAGVSGIVHKS